MKRSFLGWNEGRRWNVISLHLRWEIEIGQRMNFEYIYEDVLVNRAIVQYSNSYSIVMLNKLLFYYVSRNIKSCIWIEQMLLIVIILQYST